jgi:hypothetical protein
MMPPIRHATHRTPDRRLPTIAATVITATLAVTLLTVYNPVDRPATPPPPATPTPNRSPR